MNMFRPKSLFRVALMATALTGTQIWSASADTDWVARQSRNLPPISAAAIPGQPAQGYFYDRQGYTREYPDRLLSAFLDGSRHGLTVVDIGLEVRRSGSELYYRVHLLPHGTRQALLDQLPAWVQVYFQGLELSAPLPQTRTPDASGLISTDWVYCSACIDRTSSDELEAWRSLPDRASTQTEMDVFFRSYPSKPVEAAGPESSIAALGRRQSDIFALKAAEKAREAELAAAQEAEEERLYGDAREAYATVQYGYGELNLTARRTAECGTLNLISINDFDEIIASDFEDTAENNKAAFNEHVACVDQFLQTMDYADLHEILTELKAREASIWPRTHLPPTERTDILGVREMLTAQEAYFDTIAQSYDASMNELDDAWDNFILLQASAAEAAHRRWIREQIDLCLMGLAQAGNLGPYSEGYCRSLAQQGVSGLDAAAQNNAVSRSGATSSRRGKLLYARPGLQTFDVQGMMDNAQAAAQGDLGALWDESGAVAVNRTVNAAEYPGRSRKTSDRSVRSDVSPDRPNMERTLPSPDLNENGEAQSAAGTEYYVTYIAEDILDAGAVTLTINSSATVPGTPISGRVTNFIPFVVSSQTCSSGGVMQARYMAAVRLLWTDATANEHATAEALLKSPGKITSRDNSRPADLQKMASEIGTQYLTQPVYWGNSSSFAAQVKSTGCETILWNGDFEQRIN